jgi:mannose/fructose/N-acetylgalactosamine-specific phosphotransferase system component IID
VRTLAGVLVVLLVLAPLAAVAVRGRRRAAWAGDVEGAGRGALQTVVEGLIVLGVVVVGVVIAVALLD